MNDKIAEMFEGDRITNAYIIIKEQKLISYERCISHRGEHGNM